MIVVGFDFSAMEAGGKHFKSVASLNDLRAAFGELDAHSDDAFAFLNAESSQLHKFCRLMIERRNHDCCQDAIPQVADAGNDSTTLLGKKPGVNLPTRCRERFDDDITQRRFVTGFPAYKLSRRH